MPSLWSKSSTGLTIWFHGFFDEKNKQKVLNPGDSILLQKTKRLPREQNAAKNSKKNIL